MCQSCQTALDKLTEAFGDEAWDLLWSYTCFPFDGEKALEQANSLIERAKTMPLEAVLAEEEAKINLAMSQLAERRNNKHA